MRDPDLIVRAQRAATELESAWCHWRNVHGLTADPLPTVSSYVGYSLDAPWGEARIVFGICAEEAEQLATLLEGHDCFGPVHASVTAKPIDGAGSTPLESDAGQPGAAGRLHVPAPAPASAGQQPLSASAIGSRHGDLLAPRRRGPERDLAEASPLTAPMAPAAADGETPIARAASRALEASLASRRAPAPAPAPAPVPAPPPAAPPLPPPAPAGREASSAPGLPEQPDGEGDRHGPEATEVFDAIEAPEPPEVMAFRMKRPVVGYQLTAPVPPDDQAGADDTVQTPAPGRSPATRDRVSSAAVHAEAATWAASEVPGQAAVSDPAV
jgi:hypothetical protein